MTKAITEKDGLHKDWMKRAEKMTLAELPEFLRELTEDYTHDYGTICHAIAAAAVAAAWAVEHSPAGGITGFQAGAVTWEMIRGWNSTMIGTIGTRIQKVDDLLFPQYVDSFNGITITTEQLKALRERAKELLAKDTEHVDKKVFAHWQSIVNGKLPDCVKVKG